MTPRSPIDPSSSPADLQRLARQVLDVGSRIDFDTAFREAVTADAYGALTGAGVPPLVATALIAGDEEVMGFADPARAVAARAHAWGMDLLRRVGGRPTGSGP